MSTPTTTIVKRARTAVILCLLLLAQPFTAFAQSVVPSGSGSYASFPPPSKGTIGFYYGLPQVQVAQFYGMLHLDPSQAGKPIPTNKWWTDLLVGNRSYRPGDSELYIVQQDPYGGNIWFIPGMINPEAYGIDIYTPNTWKAPNSNGSPQGAIDAGTKISLRGDIPYGLPGSDVLIADFENGYPAGTTITGTGFATPPSTGSGISNMISTRLANTRDGGNGAQGVVSLPNFTVNKQYLHFQMCGGNTTATQVRLIVGGNTVLAASGVNSTSLQWVTWDVSAYSGQTARVEIVDQTGISWGFIAADQFFLSDVQNPVGRFGGDMAATSTLVTNWGDWSVDFSLADASSRKMDVTVVRGAPFTWTRWTGLKPKITLGADTTFYDASGNAISTSGGSFTASQFAFTAGGKHYGVYLPDNTVCTVGGSGASAWVSPQITGGANNYLVIGYLPAISNLSALGTYAFARPTNTELAYTYQPVNNRVRTTWNITTTAMKGGNTQTIQGFLPHHTRVTTRNFSFQPYTYNTQRGLMQVAAGTSFQVDFPFSGIVPVLPAPQQLGLANDFSPSRMNTYLTSFNPGPMVGETYGAGKSLTLAAQLMSMAYEIGDMTNFNRLKTALTSALENWLTYTPGESTAFFSEYSDWKALIGWDTSYGSQAFNDLHFHYGYYASAAGILGQYDKTFLTNYGPMLRKVVKSFANYDRTDLTSPFFRTFDIWEGHSNAGGLSGANGVNQESSSEAMNSWVGMYLLGTVLGDAQMTAAGAMGFAMESRSTNEYWTDLYQTNFPASFNVAGAGMVWSDSFSYSTYFSGDPAWVYAIQYVPAIHYLNYLVQDQKATVAAKYQQMWQERTNYINGFDVWNSSTAYAQYKYLNYQNQLYYANAAVPAGQAPPGSNPAWVNAGNFTSETLDALGSYVGNYVLGYELLWNAEAVVATFEGYFNANRPIAQTNNSLAAANYYTMHAVRQLGDQDFTYSASVPTAAVYYNAATNTRTAVVYNPNATTTNVSLYKGGATVQTVSVPANSTVKAFVGNTPAITSFWKAEAMLTASFSYQITATNSPTSYSVVGSLPAGLSLNTSTGLISGTPTSVGTTTVTIRATNANGTGSKQLTIQVVPFTNPPAITSATTAPGQLNTPFSYQITATNSPTGYSIVGTLPSGLALNTSTGLISGNPTTAGTFSVTVRATNAGGTGQQALAISVLQNYALTGTASASSQTTGQEADKAIDGNLGTRWTANGGSYPQSWQVDFGTGKSIQRVDIAWLSPTSRAYKYRVEVATNSAGPWTEVVDNTNNTTFGNTSDSFTSVNAQFVRVTVTGATAGFASAFEIAVLGLPPAPPTITSALSATGTVGQSFSYQIAGSNSPTSYGATGLPSGLSVNTTTGVISGTPSTAATTNVTISATNSSGTGSATLGLTVNPPAPVITSATTATGTVGSAFSYTITATNSPTSYSASGLPSGLSINTSTGVISGTPTATGTSNVTIGATNVTGSDSKTLTLTVNASGGSDVLLSLGQPTDTSSYTLTSRQGSAAVDASLTTRWESAQADPQSIYVDLGSAKAIHKVVLRWETAAGKDYKIQVTNDPTGTWIDMVTVTNNTTANADLTYDNLNFNGRYVRVYGTARATGWGYSLYNFEVWGAGSGGGSTPVITSASTASGTVGTAFSYQITATNSPTSYSASGLPSGLSINTTTGAITGTPTAPGTSNITIGATNASGSDSETLVLTVAASGGTNLALAGSASASSAEGGNVATNGNDGNTTGTRWTASNGTFPQWWKVDLGSNKTLTRADIFWFSSASRSYKYLVETSTDDVNYTTRVDKSGNTTVGNTSDAFSATARYVRITVTGSSAGWASAYEFQIFGN